MKKRVFALVTVLLLVLSVFLVFAQSPMMGRGEERKGKGMQMRELIEELNLTPEQETKMVDLRFTHQQEIIPLQRDLQKKRIELKAELEKENPNIQLLDKLSDEISALMGKIKKARLHFLLSIKSILTKEQWQIAKGNFFEEEGNDFGLRGRMRKECRMMPKEKGIVPPPPAPQK